ncbi:hypothetical protein GCM10009745_76920 [Kribbella yunnanensis]|uniref:Uncharacterized protein n=1 Tax=Kribbella yunnanensis TaxID=190194 RepID=A0ABN2J2Y4_9ACTN
MLILRTNQYDVARRERFGAGDQQMLATPRDHAHEFVEVRVRVQLGVARPGRDPHPGRVERTTECVRLETQYRDHINTVQILGSSLLVRRRERPEH